MADGMASSGTGFTLSETGSSMHLRPLDLETLLRTEFPPREMLLAPWLPEKGLAMVYGPRGTGKSHVSTAVPDPGPRGSRMEHGYRDQTK